LVVPTAIFGMALLADDHVPKLQAFAEFLGWCTLCILVSVSHSSLLKRARAAEKDRFIYLVAAVLGGLVFLLLAVAEAQPNTPDLVKDIFTRSLQVLGVVGPLALIWLGGRFARNSYRA
jgi:hypothetical protein